MRIEDNSGVGALVSAAVTSLTLGVAFTLMALGVEAFWVTFIVGFGGVLPMSMALVKYRQEQSRSSTASPETESPLAELRSRYARGELTDEEFESRVEHLLETEPGQRSGRQPSKQMD